MPRIRYIKPEFFKDEDLAQLPPLYRLAFAGLWCYADKEGRLKDRPMQLKIEILPYDEANFDHVLDTLSNSKPVNNHSTFITRYEHDGNKYIQINKFKEHQKPHNTEKDSSIPPPEYLKGMEKGMEKGMIYGKGAESSSELNNVYETVKKATVRDFIGNYCEAFKSIYGTNPIITAKDSGIAKRLCEIPDIQTIMESFFKSKDKFIVQNCHSLSIVESQINKLIGRRGKKSGIASWVEKKEQENEQE